MPPYYEHAAHLLLMLTRTGCTLSAGIVPSIVLAFLAGRLHGTLTNNAYLSHADAAESMLRDLEKNSYLTCDRSKRARVIAVIGTTIGNLESGKVAA